MILVVGGLASGKRTYVRALGYSEADMSADVCSEAPVLVDLHDLLKAGPLSDSAWDGVRAKQVVVCCEVGAGVVPADASERAWRELVGRTCATLASDAQTVVRMVCGIPQVLKG